MKKNNKDKNKIKKLKKDIEFFYEKKDYDRVIEICNDVILSYSKSYFAYEYYIKAKTKDFNKYLTEDELKDVKKYYEEYINLCNSNEKEKFKLKYNEYLYDIKEVQNLDKIKKEIISNLVLKKIYNNSLILLKQNIELSSSYDENGKRIKSIYDLVNGLFLIACLIYNIIFPNIFLLVTGIFGVFGIITVYSFIESNFFKKGKLKTEIDNYNNLITEEKEKLNNLKKIIKENDETISFLKNNKKLSLGKIPNGFKEDIESFIIDDEEKISDRITYYLEENNIALFNNLLETNTNLKSEELINKLEFYNNKELTNITNDKKEEKKNEHNKIIYMKNIRPYNKILTITLLFISVASFFILINNFYEMNIIAFIVSILSGILQMLIYNIDTGRNGSVTETFSDNLLSTIFSASLSYDLIYLSIYKTFNIKYLLLQIPIIFTLIFIGFVYFISILKYSHLLKKLSS